MRKIYIKKPNVAIAKANCVPAHSGQRRQILGHLRQESPQCQGSTSPAIQGVFKSSGQ